MREALYKGRRAGWWRRRGSKRRGFWYEDAGGLRVTDEEALERIQSLVLPPGWLEVLVNPRPGGRIQAVGIDACGRLQYRYHAAFAARRQERKYSKLARFGERLPLLRKQAAEDLEREALGKERVLAAITRLVNDLYIRIGSESSVRRYKTFGVTTLLNRHVQIKPGGRLEFNYVGKRRIRHRKILVDKDLGELLQDLKSIGGARLFNYLDDTGQPRPLRPADVNRYIKEAMGAEFSSKDFRTWHGTLLAAQELAAIGFVEGTARQKRAIAAAVRKVAEHLGNTPAVCRKSYIHPEVMECYTKGITLEAFRRKDGRIIRLWQREYEPEEIALLSLLKCDGQIEPEIESKRLAAA